MITVGSLFSGIGGLELGLERAGLGPVLWQCEQDAWCREVLATRWPSAERFDDVRAVGAQNLREVDLICGGFPCQDLSYAGKGAGLEGTRSGLWFEYLRIIRELRPSFVVVENVSALLARGLDVVLGSLASSGYDAVWDCIPAAAVGAPHRRDRVFIIACLANARSIRRGGERVDRHLAGATREESCAGHQSALPAPYRSSSLADPKCARPWLPGPVGSRPMREGEAGHVGPAREGFERYCGHAQSIMGRIADGLSFGLDEVRAAGHRWPSGPQEPQAEWEAPRIAEGIPHRARRLKALGNAVVPQVAEVIGRALMSATQTEVGT